MTSTFTVLRSLQTLLLLTTVASCGAPGSDAVFTKDNPKIPAADSTKAIASQTAPPVEFRQFSGYYRRLNMDSRFQPCGTTTPLEIIGTYEGRALLHDRFRWMAVETGRKMFGIFRGTIVTDTLKPQGAAADTAAVTTRTRFFITGVDTLRTWNDRDCNGMRVP